jgi:hypothetical protein
MGELQVHQETLFQKPR